MSEKMKITKDQASAFLGSLFPAGEHCYLHNPTLTYFEALLGDGRIPKSVPGPHDTLGYGKKMSALLRAIADAIDEAGPPQ